MNTVNGMTPKLSTIITRVIARLSLGMNGTVVRVSCGMRLNGGKKMMKMNGGSGTFTNSETVIGFAMELYTMNLHLLKPP